MRADKADRADVESWTSLLLVRDAVKFGIRYSAHFEGGTATRLVFIIEVLWYMRELLAY